MSLDHGILPKFVYHNKFPILIRELFLNILCTKNILKIHPLSLTCQPLVDNFRDKHKFLFKFFNFFSDLSYVSRTHHRLNFKLMVIKGLHDVFNRPNNELIFTFSIRIDNKVQLTPFSLDLFQLVLNLFFTSGSGRNLFHGLQLVNNSVLE